MMFCVGRKEKLEGGRIFKVNQGFLPKAYVCKVRDNTRVRKVVPHRVFRGPNMNPPKGYVPHGRFETYTLVNACVPAS